MRRIVSVLALLVLLFTLIPVLPVQAADISVYTYPILDDKLQYYCTTFPSGLRYSPGWYGTFSYAPPAADILLFDDDWSSDFGICIFAMKPGIAPSGEQGGTTLQSITQEQADSFIKSYTVDAALKPFDAEIQQVMPTEAYFTGAWAGEKLKQKWEYGSSSVNVPPKVLTDRQKEYLADIAGKPIKEVDLTKYDPDRFWVGNGGNWSDNVTHWSASTGGAPGASIPTSADSVFFDASSFTVPAQIVTVDAPAYCLDMNWTGTTNTPTFAGAFDLEVYGSLTFIADVTQTYSAVMTFKATGVGKTITTGGTLACAFLFSGNGGEWTLQDNVNIGTRYFRNAGGSIITGGFTITCGAFSFDGGLAPVTLTLGASIINCASFANGGGGITIPANTSTINVSGTGVFIGGSITTYNNINLNGTAHTVSGSFTANSFSLTAGTTQTITFTSGYNQTATTFSLSGSSGHQHTLQSSDLASWNITQAAGAVNADYVTISRSTAGGGATFSAVGGSVDGGDNVGWDFPLTAATVAASPVTMDKDGVTSVGLRGTITDMGGSATVGAWFDYGLTAAYGSTTSNVTYGTDNFTGVKTDSSLVSLTPGETYHFRRSVTSGAVTTSGADETFALTMPTVATSTNTVTPPTVTLRGNVTTMGVASSAYVRISYGTTPALGSITPAQIIAGTGIFFAIVPAPTTSTILYYRADVIVGATTVSGAVSSASIPAATGGHLLNTILLVILAAVIIVGVTITFLTLGVMPGLIAATIGVVGFAIISALLATI